LYKYKRLGYCIAYKDDRGKTKGTKAYWCREMPRKKPNEIEKALDKK
jgi:hypothetical protein